MPEEKSLIFVRRIFHRKAIEKNKKIAGSVDTNKYWYHIRSIFLKNTM